MQAPTAAVNGWDRDRFGDTGVTPAYRASDYRGHARGAGVLVFGVVVLTILFLVGVSALAINHWKPQWLAEAHLPHSGYNPNAVAAGASTTTTAPRSTPTSAHGAATAQHATTTAPPRSTGHTSTTVATVSVGTSSADAATINVRAQSFTVTVSAVGGPAWTQVTDSQHQGPVFSQVINAGQTQVFSATKTLTVEVGSSAAQLTVSVNGKPAAAAYVPQAAPFTITYQSVS
jgi:Domain of unknown function (DUF4115)